ncbi:MAG: cell envelope integrity protein TolA [Alphaproteobacteria bacterium]|nr:cell envelope integrity protein TolA [Alphaproteobacteria bacterium]
MGRAAIYSAILHLTVFVLALVGLPSLFSDEPLVVRAITVEVVTIDEETAAPSIDPDPSPPKAEPEPQEQAALPPPEPPEIAAPEPVPEPPPVEAEVPPPPPEKPPEPEPAPKKEVTEKKEDIKPPQTTPRLKPELAVRKKKERKNTDFDSVLRSVAEPESEQQRAAPQTASAFSERLTLSELDAIRHQIELCWNVPVGARDAKNLVVELNLDMNPDGSVRQVRLIDGSNRYQTDAFYRAAVDSAMRAVLNPMCNPLKLPPNKYNTWRNFTLNFNPRDML